MKRLLLPLFLLSLLVSPLLVKADTDPPTTPTDLTLYQATFTKASIYWGASTDDVGVSVYEIWRDNQHVATSTECEYQDIGLTPETMYEYKVVAVDAAGNRSAETPVLKVRTLRELTIPEAAIVQQAVELVDPAGMTPEQLLTAVQNALASLGYTGNLDTVDQQLLLDQLNGDVEAMNEPIDPEEPNDPDADRAELDQLLVDHFQGHSFLDVYLQAKISELGERHWQARFAENGDIEYSRTEAAMSLLDNSLMFMSDHPAIVCMTLMRMAYYKENLLTEQSTRQEIVDALADSRATMMRYFSYFPTASDIFAEMTYTRIAQSGFKRFPQLLSYNNYEQTVYQNAADAAQAVYDLTPSVVNETRLNRIKSWELGNLVIRFEDANGTPIPGTASITNISPDIYFWNETEEPLPLDQRSYSFDGTPMAIPVYLGHHYDIVVHIEVAGGDAWKFNLLDVPQSKGMKVTYDHGQGPTIEPLADPDAPCELVVISSQPDRPYNLVAQKAIDTFTLSWAFVPPTTEYVTKEYKVFRGGLLVGTVTDKTMSGIPLEHDDNCYTYTVIAYDQNDVPSTESLPIEVLPNFSEEQAAYYAWKQAHYGDTPVYDYQDTDGDGLTTYQEYQLQSNPTLAAVEDVKSQLSDVLPGLLVDYYQGSDTATSLSSYLSSAVIASGTVASPNFEVTTGNILGSGIADYVGAAFNGYIDIPRDGYYTFYLTTDDGSRLYLNGMLAIDNDYRHSMRLYSKRLYLHEGVNAIRLEYFEYTGSAGLILEWSGDDFGQQSIPTGKLWHTSDTTNSQLAEYLIRQKDSDFDGLQDYLELQLGTDINNWDSDSDGLSDGDEVLVYLTDPTKVDTDMDGVSDFVEVMQSKTCPIVAEFYPGDVQDILTVAGSDFSAELGDWRVRSGTAFCADRRGHVEYTVNIPEAHVYRLRTEVTERYATTSDFDLKLLIDGELVSRQTLTCDSTSYEDFDVFTPYLTAGQHTIRLVWDGYLPYSSLQIRSLTFQKLGGPDADENGIQDWIDYRLSQMCSVKGVELGTVASRTSPACIEGAGQYLSKISITDNPVVYRATDGNWFTDIALDSAAAKTVQFSFQDGGKVETYNLIWDQTNALLETNEIVIRAGDSLLLNAHPEAAVDGSYSIDCNGQNYTNPIAAPVTVLFDTAGIFPVASTYTAADGTQQTNTVNVKVVDYAFSETIPVCWNNRSRTWDIPQVPEGVNIQASSTLKEFALSSNQPADATQYYMTLEGNDDSWVIARAGENGPIITNTRIQGLDVFSSYQTSVGQIDSYEDGTKVYRMLVISSPVVQDIRVNLKIFVSGVVFDDGTIEKDVMATDFDTLGQKNVIFIYPPEATTSVCHRLNIYQNGVYIGTRY